MPTFVKSGKYYYKINNRTKEKTRISKDEYMKHNSLKQKVVNKPIKSKKKTIKKHSPVKKSLKNVHLSNSLDEEIRKKLVKIGKEKLTHSMAHVETDLNMNGKTYKVYAKVGKCPQSNYYIYNIIAKHISDNKSYQTVYQKSLMSSSPISL